MEMNIIEKIKTIDNKIEQNKAPDVLPEKDLLERASTLKRFEYLSLGKKLKAQFNAAGKQYQKLKFLKALKRKKKTQKVELSRI